jgi:hypothetical protein
MMPQHLGEVHVKVLGLVATNLLLFCPLSLPANSETFSLKANLNAAQETPPNDSPGTGILTGTYDSSTNKICWNVAFSNLTGTAISAHFHGPAPPGKNANVLLSATGWGKSPIEGCARPDEVFIKYLNEGNIYFNIHTFAHKAGEIRGQLTRVH